MSDRQNDRDRYKNNNLDDKAHLLLKQKHANEHQVLPWKHKRVYLRIPEAEPDNDDHDECDSVLSYPLIAMLMLLAIRNVLNVV